jgi:diguanylate cyclase (GGDEF)-like protein
MGPLGIEDMTTLGPGLVSSYDYRLVALSVVIAILAAYAALDLAGRVTYTRGPVRLVWLIGGAIAMGIGIWSMHYVGMLAYHLQISVLYDWPTVLLSLLAAILACAIALFVVSRKNMGLIRASIGGAFMGGGIAAMHYTGMAAMRLAAMCHLSPSLVVLSVVLAVVISFVALLLTFYFREESASIWPKISSAVIMGAAIPIMHYTGMAAATFISTPAHSAHSDTAHAITVSSLSLAGIVVVTFIVLGVAILSSLVGRRFSQMTHSAQHDSLTTLPNRVLLNDRLTNAIASASRYRHKLAVLFLDLDSFKHVNDSLGHAIGDKLLKAMGERLPAAVRKSDTVSRQGGDEFVVVLSAIEQSEDASLSATKIIASVIEPYLIEQHELHVTVSVGISIYPDDGAEAEALIQNADNAMYHAKETGGNKYQYFKEEMNVRAVQRQSLEASLRCALVRHEYELHYQPKIDLKSGKITGAEALVRWRHPERGLIPPAEFIPIAEGCGLIVPIGQWVLSHACRQVREWQSAGLPEIPVAVNISSVEFRDKNFLANLRAILRETGCEPRLLELELTESALMQCAEFTLIALRELRAMGVQLAVDDFGTGYSSLSYLSQFPISSLKIDQSFVQKIDSERDAAPIISTVIYMGRGLMRRVIAEGVETREQCAFLQSRGCDEGQGYYFSHPVLAKEFAKLLESGISETVLN